MPLSWNEIKSRAMAYSRQWRDAARERGEAVPFRMDFFEVFGISNRCVASFEHTIRKHGGGQGFIDLFWPGQMLVEHKSRSMPLEPAFDQALGYFPGIAERVAFLFQLHQRIMRIIDPLPDERVAVPRKRAGVE